MDGKVGCSFVVYDRNLEIHNQKYRLHNNCTVFQSELLAILKATEWVNENLPNNNIHIHTDSFSAYNIINGIKLHPLAVEIRNKMKNSTCAFELSWVRSLHGLMGNERADSLAKAAAQDSTIPLIYNKISRITLRQLLWEEAINQWQIKWNENDQCITYQFIPDLSNFFKIKWFVPDYYTTQLFTNHGKFASFLARFTNRASNQCPTCMIEDGTRHYVYDCIMTEIERTEFRQLLQDSNIDWPCHLSNIWINHETFSAFRRLARKTYLVTSQLIQS
ncbi:uncharacterized protein [Centruroides vittatus]|uniref:uncharacterized protein n=1 Tax=Centruroides vittatus TaxID=120091 RepID=UPI00351024D6